MTRSTDLAVWHGSTGACQQPLTGTPDLQVNVEVMVGSRPSADRTFCQLFQPAWAETDLLHPVNSRQ
jgi:hypothetical protein